MALPNSHGQSRKKKTAEDFLVKGLEEVEPAFAQFDGLMYAGLLPVHDDDHSHSSRGAEFMFWLFVPHHPTVPDTMVVWLNGGPGCSSIVGGVLLENSPVTLGTRPTGSCCMGPEDPLKVNPYAWTQATAMLYVEQPTGVGFSRGGATPHNEDDIGRDFYGFLRSFYAVFPHLQKTHRLSLFGESYAGYYVPAMARTIALENDRLVSKRDDPRYIPLDGIGLGNAWMDATVQGPAVIDYAWWHGMIDAYTRDAFHNEWKRCYAHWKERDRTSVAMVEPSPFHAFTVPDECGIMEAVLAAAGQGVLPTLSTGISLSPNTYDVTTFDPYNVIGGHNTTFTRFMNHPKVKTALNVPDDETVEWAGCIQGAGRRRRRRLSLQRQLGLLDNDEPISVVPYVAELLDRWQIRVLVYNGDLDMSTNAAGSEMLLNKMEWSGHEAWKVAARGVWMLGNSTVAGYVKKYADLTFLVVKNSGHLVPLNQPVQALDLIERFLRNQPFGDIPLPSFVLSSSSSQASLQELQSDDIPSEGSVDHNIGAQKGRWWWVTAQCVLAMVSFAAGALAALSWRRQGYETLGNSPI